MMILIWFLCDFERLISDFDWFYTILVGFYMATSQNWEPSRAPFMGGILIRFLLQLRFWGYSFSNVRHIYIPESARQSSDYNLKINIFHGHRTSGSRENRGIPVWTSTFSSKHKMNIKIDNPRPTNYQAKARPPKKRSEGYSWVIVGLDVDSAFKFEFLRFWSWAHNASMYVALRGEASGQIELDSKRMHYIYTNANYV